MTINYIERLDADSDVGCRLSYLSNCDLKGNIPRFLLNRATASLLPNVMKNLGDTARKYAAYAEENHEPGYVPPWKTRDIDWDSTDAEIEAMKTEDTSVYVPPAAAVADGPGVGDGGTTLVADSEDDPSGANVSSTPAGQLEAIVADATAFADAWFVEQRRAPTREEYLTFVRAAIRSRRVRPPQR